jgi:hypothetical protein
MTVNLPDSRIEKKAVFDNINEFPRWLYVHELKKLLEDFKDDDWLTVNKIGNLVVQDIDKSGFKVIDFYFNYIDDYTDDYLASLKD